MTQDSRSPRESDVAHIELGGVDNVLGSRNIISSGTSNGGVGESESVTRCGEQVVEGEGEMVTVLFSTRCAKFLDLQVGCRVRIHPPW